MPVGKARPFALDVRLEERGDGDDAMADAEAN